MKRRPWNHHPRIVAARSRSRAADVAVRVIEGYRLHQTSRNAAVISHYGFISVFPLFLVFTTVLGFILQDHPGYQDDIVDSALAQLPIIGDTIATSPDELSGSVAVLVGGLLIALWSGMKAFISVQNALDDVHEIPIDDRSTFVATRLRALVAIGVVGAALVASTFLTAVGGKSDYATIGNALLVLGAAIVNAAVLAAIFRSLCSTPSAWRDVAPGAVVAGIVFALLQLLGTTIVARAIASASRVYGSFAAVIALLAWLGLHATAGLLGAELNRALLATRRPPDPAPATA